MSGSVEAINDMRATQKLTSRDGRSSLRKQPRRPVKKFMIILLAFAALAVPATGSAHVPAPSPSAKTLAQKGVDLEHRYKHVSGHVKWIKTHEQRYIERYMEQRYIEELFYYQKSKRNIKKSLDWVQNHQWEAMERDLHIPLHYFAGVFKTSEWQIHRCLHSEGAHVPVSVLRVSLTRTYGDGWNHTGNPPTPAFGPLQFMLGGRPAMTIGMWGTFGSVAPRAWAALRRMGIDIPVKYMRPDSYVGQMAVGAYMFSLGWNDDPIGWLGNGACY